MVKGKISLHLNPSSCTIWECTFSKYFLLTKHEYSFLFLASLNIKTVTTSTYYTIIYNEQNSSSHFSNSSSSLHPQRSAKMKNTRKGWYARNVFQKQSNHKFIEEPLENLTNIEHICCHGSRVDGVSVMEAREKQKGRLIYDPACSYSWETCWEKIYFHRFYKLLGL